MSQIESNRRELDRRPNIRRWASPAIRGLDDLLRAAVARHASGDVLDVGCGSMPYRSAVLEVAESYDGLDVEKRHEDVRFVASATDMSPVPTDAYATVLCAEVLEHVPDPDRAMSEIARVLQPNGRLIMSVPFLARLHEEPDDYGRYTEHGLRVLCERAGLRIDEIHVTGSIASFLGHQVSTGLVGATWHLRGFRWFFFMLNAVTVVGPSRVVDRLMGPLKRRLPLGYVLVASPSSTGP